MPPLPECKSEAFPSDLIIFKGSGFYVTDSRKPGDFGGDGHGDAGKSGAGQEKPADKKPTGEEKTTAGKDSGGAKE